MEVNLLFFALFYFVFEGNFPSTSPRGLIFGGAIERRVFCATGLGDLYLGGGGLIHGGAYFGILRYLMIIHHLIWHYCVKFIIAVNVIQASSSDKFEKEKR